MKLQRNHTWLTNPASHPLLLLLVSTLPLDISNLGMRAMPEGSVQTEKQLTLDLCTTVALFLHANK